MNNKVSTAPTYNLQNRVHYGDYDIDYGAWHVPNSEFRHKKRCFDVKYKFNSFGARDDFTNKKGRYRTILLGDSVVEGYGLSKINTIDYLLEKKTNIEHLNFGTSGHFGSTQYNLIYEKIYKTYEHNKVILFITVSNDFEDDSYSFGKNVHKNRYRPYVILNENNKFELIYFNKERFKDKDFNLMELIRNLLSNNTNFYHVLRHVYVLIKSNDKIQNSVSPEKSSWFYNFTDEEIKILEHNISEIYKKTEDIGSNLYVVLVGHESDYYYKFNNDKIKNELYEKLKKDFKNKDIKFINAFDNLEINRNNLSNNFFTCDSHHNKKGVKLIVNHIFKEIYEKN